MATDTLLQMRFNADPKRLRQVREKVQEIAETVGCSKKFISDVVIAVNEACMNIIQHAYKGDRSGEIELEIINNEGELVVNLTDFAEPVDTKAIAPRDLDEIRPGGLGTFFIGEIMDSCQYAHLDDKQGNIVTMRKKIH